MEEKMLSQLANMVYTYCGLNFKSNLSMLALKSQARLQVNDCVDLEEYVQFLQANASEWEPLIEVLTINETYFYREDKQLTVYQNLIGEMLQQQTVKVWSAACSTGEEPYSLAMMTLDKYHVQKQELHIVATDINKKVLNTAKQGSYKKMSLSFRRMQQKWLENYFTDNDSSFDIVPKVKQMVSFKYLNLCDDKEMQQQSKYDVIFCRNVLIYFDEATIKKVVTHFYNALNPGGYLFLGHAEMISHYNIGFRMLQSNGTFYYRKE